MVLLTSRDYPTKDFFSLINIYHDTVDDPILILLAEKISHKDIIPLIMGYLFPEIYADYNEKEKKIYLSNTLHFEFNNWVIRTICYPVNKDHNLKHHIDTQCGYMDTITYCYKCGFSNKLSKVCVKCHTEICPVELDKLSKIHTLLGEICPNFKIEFSLDEKNRFKYIKVINIDHIWVNMVAIGSFACDHLIVKEDGTAQVVWFLTKPKYLDIRKYEYLD